MFSDSDTSKITVLLQAARSGDAAASKQLLASLYDELHRLATSQMKSERADHTLQPTALLHEAYLRLFPDTEDGSATYVSREHFFAAAALVMRRILVNHAIAKKTQKRGGNLQKMPLDQIAEDFQARTLDLLQLDQALQKLAIHDPRQASIVEMRFFGGLSVEQCAQVLEISPRTVHYEWAHARAWLHQQLSGKD